jgi:hypothetical protein
MNEPETYLGDGLYARFDGETVWLRAPRENGNHIVALEPQVLAKFMVFVAGLPGNEGVAT